MLPLIKGEANATNDTLFWEHETGKALRIGDWKISALIGGEWELFNLAKDRTETNNLAAIMAKKVEEMEAVWLQEYKRIFKVTHNN
jgi:arylsulfatase